MKQLTKIGRVFYGIGIIAYGTQQLIIKDFRPEILPPVPAWPHKYVVFPIVTGLALIIIGIIITGVIKIRRINTKNICLYLACYFLLLILIFHLPYILIFSPNKAIHLGVWAEVLKELAFCGGAFVMAGSFSKNEFADGKQSFLPSLLEKLIPFGRIFFSTTMILYGCSHFVYTTYVSPMVPAFFGMPIFWTYFGGAALIGSGIAIIFKIWIKTIALLLAVMLLLWFIFVHVPGAIANPYVDNGNLVVSAFDALLFCGTALVIATVTKTRKNVKNV
ncbi:MAG TPA: hypothetical protein VGI61_10865 [Parafilimonas sp.]